MKKLWLVVIAAVVAIGAYFQFSYVPAQRAAQEAAAAAEAAAAKAAEEAAAAAKAAEEAAAQAAKAAEDAAATATGAATKAADAVTDAATGAVDAVTGAAIGAGAAVGEAATWVWDATKLSSEEITERIASAPISQSVKDTLTATYNSVKDSPTAVQGVLDQLRQAMGL
jgi:hypothetical protein